MSPLPLVVLLLLPLGLLFLRHRRGRRRDHGGRLPPSPGAGLPVLGHLHLLGTLPHRTLRALAARHGPVLLLRLGAAPTVVISSAAAAREALKDRGLAFAGRPPMRVADRLFYGSRDMGFAPHGEYWRQVRRVCVRSLLSQSNVSSLRGIREEEVSTLVQKIYRLSGAGPVNLSELLIAHTNDIICRAALGRRHSTLPGGGNISSFFSEFVQVLVEPFVGDLIPWLGWVDRLTGLEGRVRRLHETVDAFLQAVITEHRSKNSPGNKDGDFVDMLLEAQRGTDDGLNLADDDIKALILNMFAAGTDTVYTAIEWAMAELVRHPEEMKKVQQEVRSAARGTAVTEAIAGELQYLKAAIKESFRLHPPGPLLVPRETTEETEVLGYRIPARTRVVTNCFAIGRDAGSWESPEEFRPGRFVSSEVDYKGNDFELIPFGAGRRICPGIGFAAPVLELALASLLYHFDWELPGGRAGETLDVSEAFGLDVHLRSQLLLVAKPRLP